MTRLFLAGRRFPPYKVLGETKYRTKNGQSIWECICECGKQVLIGTQTLMHGKTKDCRCAKIMAVDEKKLIQIK